MRGALYAATEIVFFLLVATLLGVLIGRFWAAATRRAPEAEAKPEEPAAAPTDAAELEGVRRQLAAVEAEKADLAKQLSVVEWQVTTLEEELAKHPTAEADAE